MTPPLIITRRWRGRDIERIAGPIFPQGLTPQAIAGHRRSAAARVARHEKIWGLLAPAVPLQPSPTLEEHRAVQRERAEQRWRENRAKWAREWRRARERLRELQPGRAAELLALWNERDGGAGPEELLQFLTWHEPPEELTVERRRCRLDAAARYLERVHRECGWYIEHSVCAEGALGVAEITGFGRRMVRCIACEQAWRKREELAAAEEAGELRIVDCRLAEQLPLPFC